MRFNPKYYFAIHKELWLNKSYPHYYHWINERIEKGLTLNPVHDTAKDRP